MLFITWNTKSSLTTETDTTQCCLTRKTQGLAREKFKYINLFSKQVKLKPKFRLEY